MKLLTLVKSQAGLGTMRRAEPRVCCVASLQVFEMRRSTDSIRPETRKTAARRAYWCSRISYLGPPAPSLKS
jgi:hypothetical protein